MSKGFKKYYPHILLLLTFGLLLFINLFFQDHWLDSDMAAEMMFSKLLTETGHIFATPDWYYSTEFRFLYTHLVMAPLFRIFTDWHTIRTITNLVFYGLLLVSYFYFLKPLKVSAKAAVLTSLFLFLPFSETMMTHMQIGNTYLSHVIIIFFCFGVFLRLCGLLSQKKGQKLIHLVFYLFLTLVCGISGIRYLLALQCPLVLAAFLFCLRSESFGQLRRTPAKEQLTALLRCREFVYLFYSLVGFASSIVGYGINAFYISKQYSFQTYDATNFISVYDGVFFDRLQNALVGFASSIVGYGINAFYISKQYSFQTYDATNFISVYDGVFFDRLQNALGALLMLFGYIPDKGVISLRGVISVISFVFIGIFVYCTVMCFKRLKNERFFVVLFLVTAFLVNCFAFVFTTSTMVPRYYITVFMFVLPVLAFYFQSEKLVFDKAVVGLLLAGCLFLSTGKTVLSEITADKNASKRPVAEFLAENGYHFGYATYTNANIITELTDGTVEIANVWDPDALNDFKWSSPAKYYKESYHTGSVFLLLTKEEANTFSDAEAVKTGEVIYDDGSYMVFLFDSVESLKACGA